MKFTAVCGVYRPFTGWLTGGDGTATGGDGGCPQPLSFPIRPSDRERIKFVLTESLLPAGLPIRSLIDIVYSYTSRALADTLYLIARPSGNLHFVFALNHLINPDDSSCAGGHPFRPDTSDRRDRLDFAILRVFATELVEWRASNRATGHPPLAAVSREPPLELRLFGINQPSDSGEHQPIYFSFRTQPPVHLSHPPPPHHTPSSFDPVVSFALDVGVLGCWWLDHRV